jgi:REP element-mobilizing transposase RayT
MQYPGAIYHVMNRGDHSEPIFRGDGDPGLFVATLAEACQKTDWQVHSFCLMSNHFHLVVETPRANLVAGMKWFLGTYTARFNRRHKRLSLLSGPHYGGPEWKESAEKKAERILAEELGRRGLGRGDLSRRRKGDPEKVEIAKRLRSETTMTWAWIAQRLGMGNPGYAANCLQRQK